MRVAQSVAEILSKHVVLEVEGIDRMYLNVYVPRLQIVEGVLGFLKKHLGHKVASTRLVEPPHTGLRRGHRKVRTRQRHPDDLF
jgi:hypothetical protein